MPMRSLARKNPDLEEENEFERRGWWISLKDTFGSWDQKMSKSRKIFFDFLTLLIAG